jgi:hypothetical protein
VKFTWPQSSFEGWGCQLLTYWDLAKIASLKKSQSLVDEDSE